MTATERAANLFISQENPCRHKPGAGSPFHPIDCSRCVAQALTAHLDAALAELEEWVKLNHGREVPAGDTTSDGMRVIDTIDVLDEIRRLRSEPTGAGRGE